MAEQAREYTNSVERAVDILEYIADCGRGVSVSEISITYGINRTSVYSILNILIKKGYIRKTPDGKYNLTGRMFEFGQKFRNSFPIVHVARGVGRDINLNYSCFMNIAMYFSGISAVLMNSIDLSSTSTRNIDRSMIVGQSIPLYATSMGKILLAYMPPANAKEVLSQLNMMPYTDKTLNNVDLLRMQMNAAVDNGYASEDGEFYAGTFCFAAPVFDNTNSVIAACSLSCSETNTHAPKDQIIHDVKRIAKTISIELGSTLR